jgi:amino acid transporter
VAPVDTLAAVNLLGVAVGKTAQNILSAGKVIGLGAIVAAGAWIASTGNSQPQPEVAPQAATAAHGATAQIGLALVFVMYAYGGWSHAAYVAAEVRDERRNLPRALLLGIAAITLIYVVVNATYLIVLGFDGARRTATPAADVMEQACGPWGSLGVSLLVMLSALAAINGMILTGSRVYAVWGADYPALAWLGKWNRRAAAPTAAIATQSAVALLLILLVGTEAGRDLFDGALRGIGLAALPWDKYMGGFETLVAGSGPIYWAFTMLTTVSVFVLRVKDRSAARPFRIPLFPLPPLVFCGICAYMLWAGLVYARWLALLGAVPLVLGVGIWPLVGSGQRRR